MKSKEGTVIVVTLPRLEVDELPKAAAKLSEVAKLLPGTAAAALCTVCPGTVPIALRMSAKGLLLAASPSAAAGGAGPPEDSEKRSSAGDLLTATPPAAPPSSLPNKSMMSDDLAVGEAAAIAKKGLLTAAEPPPPPLDGFLSATCFSC